MCYRAKFGRSVLKAVGINTEEPQNWGALELRSLKRGSVADSQIYAPPDMCYSIKFGSSATRGVRIYKRNPQNYRVLGPCPLSVGELVTP